SVRSRPPSSPLFPTRRSSDLADEPLALAARQAGRRLVEQHDVRLGDDAHADLELTLLAVREVPDERVQLVCEPHLLGGLRGALRSEEHTSELQSRENLVCRLL